MNITTIKKTGATTLTTSRECQIAGYGKYLHLNSNPKPGYEDWYHPRTNDPSCIIPAGTTLRILAVAPDILVEAPCGRTLSIHRTHLSKLTL